MLLCSYSQEESHIELIEQNKLYTPNSDPNQDLLNPHKDRTFQEKLVGSPPNPQVGGVGGVASPMPTNISLLSSWGKMNLHVPPPHNYATPSSYVSGHLIICALSVP